MASSSEIEKLERRYTENPEGRFFAPLADAYRKAGQLSRALELVRAGLQKHPDYLSARIVLGRCLLDQGNDTEAASTFDAVLTLDSENIIALKSLAEIAERGGKPVEARQWLQRLLVVDSMNSEAAADLQRLGGAITGQPTQEVAPAVEAASPEVAFADLAREMRPGMAQAEPAAAAELSSLAAAEADVPAPARAPEVAAAPVAAPPPVPAPAPRRPTPFELVEEPAAAGASAPAPASEPAPLEVMPFDDSLDWGTGERASRSIRAEDVASVVRDESVATPAIEFASGIEGAAPPPATPAPPPSQPQEFVIEKPEDQTFPSLAGTTAAPVNVELPANLSGAFSLVDDVPAAAVPAPAATPRDLPLIMPEDVTPPEELSRPSAKLVQMVSPAPHEEPAAVGQPMVTETMGDLYLKQGFRSEAADVYRRLLSQRPGDQALSAKLRGLEAPPPNLSAAALGGESVAVWLRRVAAARLPAPGAPGAAASAAALDVAAVGAAAPAPPADAAGPTPMEAAFSASSAEAVGEPAHPAPEAFSLDQIFGSATETPPPAPEGAPASPAPPSGTGTSFDEFFGQPGQGSVRPAKTASDRPSKGEDEDLGEFNAWLQSLKK